MNEGAEDDNEKPLEPTQRKLEEARRKGDVAKSNDLITAASYAGFLLVFLTIGRGLLTELGSSLSWFFEQPDKIAQVLFQGSASSVFDVFIVHVSGLILPWFLLPAVLSLITVLVQRSFVVTPSLLLPKFSRVSPLDNAKQKFGRTGLFEFSKSFVKLLIYSTVLWVVLQAQLDEMMATLWADPKIMMLILADLFGAFLISVLCVALTIGIIDLIWQQQEHIRKNRMSYKEMKDEAKEAEGDPHLKQERRQRAYDFATNRMMLDVPKADVVIVNPTHYAVALKWSRKPGEAPVCVAKGVDEVAKRIRVLAAEHAVPMHSDPPAARALFATTDIGSEIAPDHYRAVAAAIRFAETIKRKAGMRL
jgi:flagellar biosynthesis protein FlhB